MKIDEIKELIQALENSSLTTLELCEGDSKIFLEKAVPIQVNAPMQMSAMAPQTMPAISPAPEAVPATPAADSRAKGTAITCPLVGVFYAASTPDDAPFVKAGDQVKKGDVLCIIEAMKLMNEITAETDGQIAEVCVQNGEVVDYGQPLFYLT